MDIDTPWRRHRTTDVGLGTSLHLPAGTASRILRHAVERLLAA